MRQLRQRRVGAAKIADLRISLGEHNQFFAEKGRDIAIRPAVVQLSLEFNAFVERCDGAARVAYLPLELAKPLKTVGEIVLRGLIVRLGFGDAPKDIEVFLPRRKSARLIAGLQFHRHRFLDDRG